MTIGGLTEGAIDFDARVDAAPDAPLPSCDPEDLATLNYSGGTTGAPKGIALRHRNLSAVLAQAVAAFDIPQDAVFMNVRPLWPIAQLVTMAHLTAGATVALQGRFNPAAFADQIAATGATRTSLVPTQLYRLLDCLAPEDQRLNRLQAIYIGGSRLALDVFRRALTLIGPKIGVLYGMTEAPISAYLTPQSAAASEQAMNTVGAPAPGCEIRVFSNEGATNAPSKTGEVLIRGANVMQGYWRAPEATQSALRDGWLHTGDLGVFDAEGRLAIVGRIKDVIRSGAQSIVSAEVEDALAAHPAVADVAVLGLPDPEWGEAVTAFVVLKDGVKADQSALIEHCRNCLASFKKPRSIRFVTNIPRSHYGKVQRDALLEVTAHE